MSGLGNIKMKPKLISLFLLVGVIPLAAVGFLSSRLSSNALNKNAVNQLSAVRGIKKANIETYFGERQGDLGVLNETVNTLRREMIEKLKAVREIKKNQQEESN